MIFLMRRLSRCDDVPLIADRFPCDRNSGMAGMHANAAIAV